MEIKGASEREVKLAGDVMISLRQMYDQGEKLNSDTVYRLLEDVQDGMLDETFQAMGNVVALNHKGMPIKCKTMGQKNYVKALRDNVGNHLHRSGRYGKDLSGGCPGGQRAERRADRPDHHEPSGN